MRARLVAFFFLALVSAAGAQPLFLSILPPGQDGFLGSTLTPGPHALDQLPLYRDLIVEAPGLTDADLTRFFNERARLPAVDSRGSRRRLVKKF
jgi:hypothetical protein